MDMKRDHCAVGWNIDVCVDTGRDVSVGIPKGKRSIGRREYNIKQDLDEAGCKESKAPSLPVR